MEKLLFLFGRVDGMTLADFREHYLTRHTELAKRLTQGVHRYVVTMSAGDGEPQGPPAGSPVPADAMTEIWTDSAASFFTGASYASKEDAEIMTRDHMSFIGPMHAWLVEPEVKEEAPAARRAAGRATPGVKYVVLNGATDGPPTLAGEPELLRHVRNRVVRAMLAGTPDLETIDEFLYAAPATPPATPPPTPPAPPAGAVGRVYSEHVIQW